MDLRVLRIAKGILAGLSIDLICSFLFSLVWAMVLAIWLSFNGVDDQELAYAIREAALTFPWLAISVLAGVAISVFAGFVAANIIQYNYSQYLGVLGTLLALVNFTGTLEVLSLRASVFFALLTLSAILAGGWLHDWANRPE
jgi:hypothetical protein